MNRPLFFVIEGIDGSGKTTQAKLLESRLQSQKYAVYRTFEPTDRPVGKLIRSIFAGEWHCDERVIASLFVADRLDHLVEPNQGILSQLQQGKIVVSDRYYFSSYAYHGIHTDLDWLIQSNEICAKILRPTLTIWIDVEPEIAMNRLLKSRPFLEPYETIENLKKVREKYLEAFQKLSNLESVQMIDGNDIQSKISEHIWKLVSQYLL